MLGISVSDRLRPATVQDNRWSYLKEFVECSNAVLIIASPASFVRALAMLVLHQLCFCHSTQTLPANEGRIFLLLLAGQCAVPAACIWTFWDVLSFHVAVCLDISKR
jgi:hypothetical protein